MLNLMMAPWLSAVGLPLGSGNADPNSGTDQQFLEMCSVTGSAMLSRRNAERSRHELIREA